MCGKTLQEEVGVYRKRTLTLETTEGADSGALAVTVVTVVTLKFEME